MLLKYILGGMAMMDVMYRVWYAYRLSVKVIESHKENEDPTFKIMG